MKNQSLTNVLVIAVVAVVLAGAVWMRSNRAQTPEATPNVTANAGEQAAAAASQPATKALPRLLDLGADKCKACKQLAPILEELRKEYAGRLDVEFIDVWKDPEAGSLYTFKAIPTQILYDSEGNEVWRHLGFISKEDLVKIFAEKVGVK